MKTREPNATPIGSPIILLVSKTYFCRLAFVRSIADNKRAECYARRP